VLIGAIGLGVFTGCMINLVRRRRKNNPEKATIPEEGFYSL
jgi:hypothetical protein